jgi:hypothetical protein
LDITLLGIISNFSTKILNYFKKNYKLITGETLVLSKCNFHVQHQTELSMRWLKEGTEAKKIELKTKLNAVAVVVEPKKEKKNNLLTAYHKKKERQQTNNTIS